MNRIIIAMRTSILLALIVIGVRPVLVAQVARNKPANIAKATQQDRVEIYGKLPLSFEMNTGQTNREVKFLSHGQGYTVFLTGRAEAVLVLSKSVHTPAPVERLSTAIKPQPESTPPAVLRMKLVGAKRAPEIEGLDELSGKTNYFIGNDPKKWRTNVPTYAKVKLRGVYPGVDLVYYGNQRQLEHDFIVAAGANPGLIRMAVVGAGRLSLNAQEDLVLAMKDGEVRFRKPVVYQTVEGARREISSSYRLKSGHRVGFQIAAYDRSRPLIIDPVLSYSTYLGGTAQDFGQGITVDTNGNAYVAGQTYSANFPTTAGAFQTAFADGSIDAFVTKLNPAGSALVYSTYLGGSNLDVGQGIALDAASNAYVTGFTLSQDFPTTAGAFQTSIRSVSAVDAFVTKLNPAGSALVYSTYLGGSNDDVGQGIAVNTAGNAYVVGNTFSADFPTTVGAFQTVFGGGDRDAFVTELNTTGSALVYSTYLGGSQSDGGTAIGLDAMGNAYVTGWTSSTNFPTTAGAFQTGYSGSSQDAFVTKLNPTAFAPLVYSTYLGGSLTASQIPTAVNIGTGIAVDAAGNAYVTGQTDSTVFPTTPGAFRTTNQGYGDAFVTKLNPTASAPLVYSTYLGGVSNDAGLGIAVDAAGNAYVTGVTLSSNFPTTANAIQPISGGPNAFGRGDAFVTLLNPQGNGLVYSSYLGGSDNEFGAGIALDTSFSAYVTGSTASTNFPTTSSAFQTTYGGGLYDAFVTKIANIVCTQKEDDDDRDDHERHGERDDHQRHNDRHKAKSHPCKGSDEMESEKRDSEKE